MTERGLGHIKVMAGGAALKQASAESLKVDFVAQTAFDGARYLDQIAGGRK
jgi:methanogenic corrinoid protein MtbC1